MRLRVLGVEAVPDAVLVSPSGAHRAHLSHRWELRSQALDRPASCVPLGGRGAAPRGGEALQLGDLSFDAGAAHAETSSSVSPPSGRTHTGASPISENPPMSA